MKDFTRAMREYTPGRFKSTERRDKWNGNVTVYHIVAKRVNRFSHTVNLTCQY